MLCEIAIHETKYGYEVHVHHMTGPHNKWPVSRRLWGPSEFKPNQALIDAILEALDYGKRLVEWDMDPLFDPMPANEYLRS